jgi:hypothetical protein
LDGNEGCSQIPTEFDYEMVDQSYAADGFLLTGSMKRLLTMGAGEVDGCLLKGSMKRLLTTGAGEVDGCLLTGFLLTCFTCSMKRLSAWEVAVDDVIGLGI